MINEFFRECRVIKDTDIRLKIKKISYENFGG